MECVICKTEFEGKTGAKYCSPRCRKKGSRINSIVTDNVTLSDENVTDIFEFKTPNRINASGFNEDKPRKAIRWEDVPIAAIPIVKGDNPEMPEWMNGRQYFLWWKNNFKLAEDGSPLIWNPFKSFDNFKYDMGGDASRKWGA